MKKVFFNLLGSPINTNSPGGCPTFRVSVPTHVQGDTNLHKFRILNRILTIQEFCPAGLTDYFTLKKVIRR